ncbi:MAG: dipicolinate synthase subunit DpsA [Clostridiales bacterium]|nr:dipicolinate synthase subunit DpsA [Clostridiales bacterium]
MPNKKEKTFLVAGGDLRQIYLANCLAAKYKVYAVGFSRNLMRSGDVILLDSKLKLDVRVDYIVLPIPATTDGTTVHAPYSGGAINLKGILYMLKRGGTVFAGKATDELKKLCQQNEQTLIDYLSREELSVLNAVPTAEGAIQIMMEEMATTIFGQDVLVVGHGRIAKVLMRYLTAFGASVDVTARKYSDLAWADINGCTGIHLSKINPYLSKYDVVINTVPAMLFDEGRLSALKRDCLVIDLASKPGGVDFDMAKNMGINTIWALSLPGKIAPITSGKIICDTILNIMDERGES